MNITLNIDLKIRGTHGAGLQLRHEHGADYRHRSNLLQAGQRGKLGKRKIVQHSANPAPGLHRGARLIRSIFILLGYRIRVNPYKL